MEFNHARYQKLLAYSYQLKKEKNQHISEVSYSDFLELLSYSATISSRIALELYPLYANSIARFLEVKISIGKLSVEFSEIEKIKEKILDMLELKSVILLPNSQANLVSKLLMEIFWILEDYLYCRGNLQNLNESKYEETDNTLQSEVYDSIREIYLQLEAIVRDYRGNSKLSLNRLELIDQFNWENRELYIELIEKYLDDSSNFLNFKEIYHSIVEVAKELESNSISFKLNYQALGFSNYPLILIQLFDNGQRDSNISPRVFKSWVRKILFEIKNHYS
jgi:hypothetical protein